MVVFFQLCFHSLQFLGGGKAMLRKAAGWGSNYIPATMVHVPDVAPSWARPGTLVRVRRGVTGKDRNVSSVRVKFPGQKPTTMRVGEFRKYFQIF